jgi:hypothetical protein
MSIPSFVLLIWIVILFVAGIPLIGERALRFAGKDRRDDQRSTSAPVPRFSNRQSS